MTITLTRNPRGSVIIRRNECLNPSVETDANGWGFSWFGTGAGTNARLADGGLSGTGYLRRTFSSTSSESGDVGFQYRHDGWSGDYTEKIASAYLRPVNIDAYGRVSLQSYNKDGGLISRQDGNPQYLGNTVWSRVSASFKCPPGTAYSVVSFWLVSGRQLAAGFRFDLDNALIEPGNVLGTYFDGDTYAAGNGSQFTTWAGTRSASQSLLNDADPATQLHPTQLADRYAHNLIGRHTVHTLMNGATAAVLMQGTKRRGTLPLLFAGEDAAQAEDAAAQLMTVGTWAYTDTENPRENMTLVVDSASPVTIAQDDTRSAWIVTVPFAEL